MSGEKEIPKIQRNKNGTVANLKQDKQKGKMIVI